MRSFTEPPGFRYSILTSTVAASRELRRPPWSPTSAVREGCRRPGRSWSRRRARQPLYGSRAAVGRTTERASSAGAAQAGHERRGAERSRARRIARRRRSAAVGGGGGLFGFLWAQSIWRGAGSGPPQASRSWSTAATASRPPPLLGSGPCGWRCSATPAPPGSGLTQPDDTVAVLVAAGLAGQPGGRSSCVNVAVVGARTSRPGRAGRRDAGARSTATAPDVAVVMVGANDVTHRSSADLGTRAAPGRHGRSGSPARRSSSAAAPTSAPSSRCPTRCASIGRRLSRTLAAAQALVTEEAGGHAGAARLAARPGVRGRARVRTSARTGSTRRRSATAVRRRAAAVRSSPPSGASAGTAAQADRPAEPCGVAAVSGSHGRRGRSGARAPGPRLPWLAHAFPVRTAAARRRRRARGRRRSRRAAPRRPRHRAARRERGGDQVRPVTATWSPTARSCSRGNRTLRATLEPARRCRPAAGPANALRRRGSHAAGGVGPAGRRTATAAGRTAARRTGQRLST